MTKILVCILIVIFTSVVGIVLAKRYRLRKKFFAQMNEFNERYLGELSFRKRPIKIFLSDEGFDGIFFDCMESFFGMDEKGEKVFKIEFLSSEENRFVYDYFSMLGRGDSYSQTGYFTDRKKMIWTFCEKSSEDQTKYGDLYLKLGFLLGLAVVILIV